MKQWVIWLLSTIEDLDGKLDMLTSIEILTQHEELYSVCVQIRNDLCEPKSKMEDFV